MRFKCRSVGERRIKRKFCLLPRYDDGKVIWLEYVYINQSWKSDPGDLFLGYWDDIELTTKEAYEKYKKTGEI